MNTFFRKIQLALIALASVSALASTVVEDSKNRFILEDEVWDSSTHPCDDQSSGIQFIPEQAFYQDGNGVPFRYYRVAIPSNAKPRVSVSNDKTIPLGAAHCHADSLKFVPIEVGTPFLKDGLWMTDIRVPLYVKMQGSVALRKQFKLQVEFERGKASGFMPGNRVLSYVANPKAASRFGVETSSVSLRREASSEIDNVKQLLDISIGDENIATFSEDGLYALDYTTIQRALLKAERKGDFEAIPVEKLCIYGAVPDTLAAMGPGTAERSPNHLFEIPLEVLDKDGDGIFSEGDSVYFVGYGNAFWKRTDAENWKKDNGGMEYFHSYSPYSSHQNFILGYKEMGKGLRMDKPLPTPKGTGKNVNLTRYVRVEKDVYLRDTYYGKTLDWEAASGKEWFWYWHNMSDTTQYDLPSIQALPGKIEDGKSFIAVTFFPHRSISSTAGVDQMSDPSLGKKDYATRMKNINFNFFVNGHDYDGKDFLLIPGGNFALETSSLKQKDNTFSVTILPNKEQCDRFDGFTVAYPWNPSTVSIDSSEWLLPGKVSGLIKIPVGTNKNLRLMKFVNFVPQGFLNVSDGYALDSVRASSDVRYLVYRKDKLVNRKENPHSTIALSGIPLPEDRTLNKLSQISTKTEYLIITPNEFLKPAIALGEFRSSNSALTSYATTVVSTENIYRHYTGGSSSPVAIRNFIAYARSVCPNLKYVLLAGSGHYNYRNIGLNTKSKPNYIPPFEREETVIEDFFAVLDSGEQVRIGNYDLDMAVSRLPVSSVAEFESYIEKARDYEEIKRFDHSEWKTSLLVTSDDAKNGTNIDRSKHSYMQEELASMIDSASDANGFHWNIKKVYLLDYEYDAAGQKREAKEVFLNMLNQGALLTNYFGHGSKVAWASEGLLNFADSKKLRNFKKYTILNSYSCTVGRFDDGGSRSLSEEFLLAPKVEGKNVGAIASIGAVRETYANQNKVIAKSFISNLLLSNGIAIGDAMLKAKGLTNVESTSQRDNNEFYVLFGEPVIRMPIDSLKISLETKLDTIKALDKIKLSGSVEGMANDKDSIALTLREGHRVKRLWSQLDEDDSLDVTYDGSLIYSEVVPVIGGRFETEFVTPKKLNFGDSTAEFRAWAYSPNEKKVGRYLAKNIKISGMSNYADSLNDKTPPTIKIQSCYSSTEPASFANNQTIKLQTPACLQVLVEDSTALDFREQADEGITFEVVGVENPYHPQPFLEQTSNRALIRKSFTTESYPPGKYVFMVRAQDVLGNMTAKVLILEITEKMKDGLADVFNVPNPVGKKGTVFYFKNLAVGLESTVDIFIYNQHGRIVKVLKDVKSGKNHWDGTDNYGRLLANGLYYYVVRNNVTFQNEKKSKTESWTKKQKLLISR